MKNIILSVPIRSTIDRFIQSITTQSGLAAWITPDVSAEPQVGSSVKLGFDAGISLTFRVDQLNPSGHVEWVLVEGPEEWKTSRVVFDAKAVDGGAINYTFTHTNLPEESGLTSFMGYGWGQHARSLKLLLETGTGEPHGSAGSRGWHPRGETDIVPPKANRPTSIATLGNHTAVTASPAQRERIRAFYRDVLGGQAHVESEGVDRFQVGECHFCIVYKDPALAESDFLRAIYLELKTADTEALKRRILGFGVKKLDVPDEHLYFQAPGGQVFRVVGIDENLSLYEKSPSARPGVNQQ